MFKTMIAFICLPLLLISAVFANTDNAERNDATDTFKISDFKQGLLTREKGSFLISEEGSVFQYNTNGTCIYNKKKTPCMWFGIAFKTIPVKKSINLDCVGSLSTPDTIGTPDSASDKKTGKFNFKLELKSNNGIFIKPQYITKETDIRSQTLTTTCSHKGKEMLSYQFVINFDAPLKN